MRSIYPPSDHYPNGWWYRNERDIGFDTHAAALHAKEHALRWRQDEFGKPYQERFAPRVAGDKFFVNLWIGPFDTKNETIRAKEKYEAWIQGFTAARQ